MVNANKYYIPLLFKIDKKIEIEKIKDKIKINNEINTLNDVCNVCKKLIHLKFNKCNFNYNSLNFDQKLNFLYKK